MRSIIAGIGCEFFVSYGMTECCGKISMSILPHKWWKVRASLILFCLFGSIIRITMRWIHPCSRLGPQDLGGAAPSPERCAQLIDLVCSSGRPFALIEVSELASMIFTSICMRTAMFGECGLKGQGPCH